MPIVTIQSPSGQNFKIDAPEGATDDQILRFAKAQGLFDSQPQPTQQPAFTEQEITQQLSDVPTEENLARLSEEAKARREAQPQETIGDKILGIGESALTIGTGATTGMIGNVLGTLDQLAKELASGEVGSRESAQRVFEAGQKLQQASTYQPRTETGQEIVTTLGEAGEQFTGLTPVAGQIANVAKGAKAGLSGLTPSRAAQATVEAASEAPSDILPIFKNKTPVKQEIARKINEGSTDPELAGLTTEPSRVSKILGIEDSSRVVEDAPANEVIRQGFDPGVIQPIKNQNKTTLNALKKMSMVQDRIIKDKEFGITNRPADIAGDVFKNRFDQVLKVNRRAGNEINRIAKTELAGEKVDLAPIGDSFTKSLNDMGISGVGEPKLNFSKSSIRGLKDLQRPIKQIYNQLLEDGGDIDALGLHQLKRQIDNTVSYNSQQKGLSGDAERSLKNLRSAINNQLRDQFPEYKKANQDYSETIGLIDEVQRIAGRQINLQGEGANKALGTLMRRLMSNAQSRVPLMNVVDQVSKYSTKADPSLIGKAPEQVNLKSLILFADELDSNFGAAARTSLQGQFDQSLARNLQDAEFLATGSPLGVLGRVAEKVSKEKDPAKLKVRQAQAQKEASRAVRRFLNNQIRKGAK